MEYIVLKSIPKTELKDYCDYIGYIFKNDDGVYNICDNEEDIMKSNQWFNNLPMHSLVVSDEKVNVGDKFLAVCVNNSMNAKTFTYNGESKKGVDLVSLTDRDGEEVLTTIQILKGAWKVLRAANRKDKEKLVNKEITPIENPRG